MSPETVAIATSSADRTLGARSSDENQRCKGHRECQKGGRGGVKEPRRGRSEAELVLDADPSAPTI